MSIKDKNIDVLCLFCGAVLTAKTNVELKPGDLIECANCGESNDYQSVLDVAKEKGIDEIKKDVINDLKKSLGKAFE